MSRSGVDLPGLARWLRNRWAPKRGPRFRVGSPKRYPTRSFLVASTGLDSRRRQQLSVVEDHLAAGAFALQIAVGVGDLGERQDAIHDGTEASGVDEMSEKEQIVCP